MPQSLPPAPQSERGATSLPGIWALTPGPGIGRVGFESSGEVPRCSAFEAPLAAELSTFAAHLAMAEFGKSRGLDPGSLILNRRHAIDSFTGHVTIDQQPLPAWADRSGAYRTADDRWVQLHCNFPHHAAGAAAILEVAQNRPDFEAAILKLNAFDLERQFIDHGMIGAAYRTLEEWSAHPHAVATRLLPLFTAAQVGDADPLPLAAPVDRPLDGVRVMDCSRVLAGPVAGQTLASGGAEVLRIGASHLPSVQVGVVSTGFGKQNTFTDLRTSIGRSQFESLVSSANVLIDAFRPGALEAFGYSVERLAQLRPGLVIIQICAFDWVGPWANRRGFDSIVQTTTGIAAAGSHFAQDPKDAKPRHLPVQVLDYATGFFGAHAAARLLARQHSVGGSWLCRLSLLRTRNWLLRLGDPVPFTPRRPEVETRYLHTVDSDFGSVTAVKPMTGRWARPPSKLGSAAPQWQ